MCVQHTTVYLQHQVNLSPTKCNYLEQKRTKSATEYTRNSGRMANSTGTSWGKGRVILQTHIHTKQQQTTHTTSISYMIDIIVWCYSIAGHCRESVACFAHCSISEWWTNTGHAHSPMAAGDAEAEPLAQREVELQSLLQKFWVQS